ncbi:polysaccharide biosynthesis C-terminal domain-containing protein [Eubacteriaceae bacterium ES2]|nr:polysaccharide biosynthesis C-terminal domain-containing protein [Eubacteriaceae bacterium ES2]
MIDNKYMRLIWDMLIFVVGTVLTKFVQFMLMPLYTSYMTVEAYGIAELTNNMSELLFPIATLCIYEAVFRFAVGSKYSKEQIVTAGLKVLIFSSVFGAVLAFITNIYFMYEYIGYLYFVLYTYSFRMFVAYYVRGKGYSKLFAMSGILNAIVLSFFSVLFLVKFKWDVKGYLLAIAFSYFFSMLFLFFGGKLYKEIKFSIRTAEVNKVLLHYSSPLIIYNVGYWLTVMSGRYFLLLFSGATNAGLYAAVIKMASVINMFQQAFYAAFQLNTAREYESKDKEEYFTNIFSLYAACILMFGSIVLCFSPILAEFTLKNEFYSAKIFLPLILFTAIFDCLFCFFKTMYTTYKLTKRAVVSMLIGAVVNIFVCLLTVNRFGIWGVCIASLLCYISQAVYRIIDVKKFVNISCEWKTIVPCLGALFIQVVLLTIDSTLSIIFACMISGVILVYNLVYYKNEFTWLIKYFSNKNKNQNVR